MSAGHSNKLIVRSLELSPHTIKRHVAGPNISPGPGNVVRHYQQEDWDRAIRHGVKPDGRPLLIMPAEDYSRLTDDDLASLVAYVRQLAPSMTRRR